MTKEKRGHALITVYGMAMVTGAQPMFTVWKPTPNPAMKDWWAVNTIASRPWQADLTTMCAVGGR